MSGNSYLNIDTILRNTIYILIISGLFGPILSIFNVFGVNVFLFRVIYFLLLILVFIVASIKMSLRNINTFYNKFFIFWLIYALVQFLWIANISLGIKHIIFLFIGIGIIIIPQIYSKDLYFINKIYNLWILILILFTFLGLLNILYGIQLTTSGYFLGQERFQNIPTAVFKNPNDYATFISISFPFLLSGIKNTKKKIIKLSFALIAVLNIYILIFTLSRANYIALMLGIFYWLLFYEKRKTLFIGVLIIFTMIFYFAYYSVIDVIIKNLNSLLKFTELSSINVRVNLIKNSFLFLINSFGLGVGPGNVDYYMDVKGVFETSGIVNPHNWWIEILANYGIIVFIGYVLNYVYFFYKLHNFRKVSKNKSEKKLSEALSVSMIVFVIASISSSSIMAFKPNWLLLSLVALFINYINHIARNAEKTLS